MRSEKKEKAREEKRMEVKVAERKIRMLNELVKLITNNNTLIISSVKGMPSAQFQKIKKKLKDKATVKVVKKRVMIRAIEEASKLEGLQIKESEKYLEEGSAILFSQLDAFELAGILADERVAIKAKPGQVALKEIHIDTGATDIPAGPMITEFSNAGIKIAIEGGKITIKESKVLVKQGEKIPAGTADILAKLEIFPFTIGLEPIAAFDSKNNKIYLGIKIDKNAAIENLKKSFADSRALAISINYPTSEIISLLLAKAERQANAVQTLIRTEVKTNEPRQEQPVEQQETEQHRTKEQSAPQQTK